MANYLSNKTYFLYNGKWLRSFELPTGVSSATLPHQKGSTIGSSDTVNTTADAMSKSLMGAPAGTPAGAGASTVVPKSPLQLAYDKGGLQGFAKALAEANANTGSGSAVTPPAPAALGSYDAFNAQFQKEYGRPITQAEQADNSVLVNKLGISNDLFRLLPLDRQMGFDSKRLALLDNTDLGKLIEYNPQVAGSFGTKRLSTFSNDFIQKTLLPYLSTANPVEAQNLSRAVQVALPKAPASGTTGANGELPPIQPGGTALGSGGTIRGPQLPGGVTSRQALDLYMQLLGLTGPERGQTGVKSSSPKTSSKAMALGLGGGPPPPFVEPGGNEPGTNPFPGGFVTPGNGAQPPVVSNPTADGGALYTDPRTGKPFYYQPPGTYLDKNERGQDVVLPVPGIPLPGLSELEPEQKALIMAQIAQIGANITKMQQSGAEGPADTGYHYQKNAYDLLLGQGQLDLGKAQLAENQRQDIARQAAQGELATGYQAGIPTLAREQATAQQSLANANYALDAAKSAAQIALSQGNLDEAVRQNTMVNALEQQKLKLQADLGYAESSRQDVATGIAQGTYQNIALPQAQQAMELAGNRYNQIELPGAEQTRQLALAQMLAQPGGYLALAAAQGRSNVPTGAGALQGLPPSPVMNQVLSGNAGVPQYVPPGSIPQGFRPLSPRTQRQMSPSQQQELGVGVNLAGGRAEDYFAESQRQGRSFGKPYNTTYLPMSPKR